MRTTIPPTTAPTGIAPSRAAEVTVRRGDTLWALVSTHLRTTGQDASPAAVQRALPRVAAANGLANPARILPGQRLDLDTSAVAAAAGARPAADRPKEGSVLEATLNRAVAKGYLPQAELARVRERILELSADHGFAPDDLARVALLESDGFNPRASNGRCFGILQFCEGSNRGAASVGYAGRAAAIADLSVLEQLELVERYLADVGLGPGSKPVALDDLYLGVLMPRARSQQDPQTALPIPGTQARVLHEGHDPSRPITRASIVGGLHRHAQAVLAEHAGKTLTPLRQALAAAAYAATGANAATSPAASIAAPR